MLKERKFGKCTGGSFADGIADDEAVALFDGVAGVILDVAFDCGCSVDTVVLSMMGVFVPLLLLLMRIFLLLLVPLLLMFLVALILILVLLLLFLVLAFDFWQLLSAILDLLLLLKVLLNNVTRLRC